MPMIRYQIRNEYGLADPELYGAASRDDPEALLEGVAMAGLVGALRQLGDLAEFAAELFHELHEEVLVTVGRGHGLMLRVQQLEAEFPSIEKAFVSQTSHSNFANTTGIDWHANLQIDRNLITRGDMPRFILNSYEECRGPPRLFMLDKFDVAGAGACLKRYTDPSFFKTELASSGTMDTELQRERKTRKIMKKVSHWRNGEVVESSMVPRISSNSQPENSEHVCENNPTRRVKLKSRCLNAMDTSSTRSYMGGLLEVHLPEQKVPLESSVSQPNIKTKAIDSSESDPEVQEIVIDNSDKYLSFSDNPTQPPTKQIAELPTNGLENHKIHEEFLEAEPTGEVEHIYSIFKILEKKETLIDSENNTEGSVNSYKSGVAEKSLSALQEVYQHNSSADTEYQIECSSDSYVSDDFGYELENYMDALTTMESEIETDSESKDKSDRGLFNVESQGMLSDNNKGQQELVGQFSEPDFVENSMAPLGLENMSNKGMSSLSDSDNSGNLTDAQPPQRYMISFDVPANSEICLGKARNRTSEEIWRNSEAPEIQSSVHLLSDGNSYAEVSIVSNLWSEIEEASSDSCVTDSTTTLIHLSPQRRFNEAQSITSDSNEVSSCFIDHKVSEHLDDNLPCTTEVSEARRLDDSPFWGRYVPAKVYPAEHVEELGGMEDVLERITKKQDESILEQVPTGYVKGLLLRELEESRKQDTEACSGGSLSTTTSSLYPDISSIVFQPDGLAAEMENVMQPEDLASEVPPSSVRGTHEVVKYLNGSPIGRGDAPEKTHPTEDDERLDLSETRNGIILDEGPAGCVEDSPLSFYGLAGEPQESIEQDGDASSDGSISPTIPSIPPVACHISVQPSVSAVETDNFVAPSEVLAYSQSTLDLENADDIIKAKILSSNELPLGFERLSDMDEPRETHNVKAAEFDPFCFGTETFLDHMQLQSICEVIDGHATVGDDIRLPFGSTTSSLHKDAPQTEQTIKCDDTLTKCVHAESVVNCHEASLRYSSELSDIHIQSQENFIRGADLDQHNLVISEVFSPNKEAVLHSERNPYFSLSPQDANLQVSTPVVSSLEFSNLCTSESSNAKLFNGECHTMPSGHAETNLGPSIDEGNQIYSLENEPNFSSRASPQFTLDIAKEASNAIDSCQDGRHLLAPEPRFEMPRFMKQDNTQKSSVELDDNQSELGLEEDSHVMVTNENISASDIPLSNTGTQRQVEPEASVHSEYSSEHSVHPLAPNISAEGLPNFASFGFTNSESALRFSEPWVSDPVLSFQSQEDVQQDVQETPPLPPLPPLEWRMGKIRLGSLTSDRNLVQPLIGTNPFTELPIVAQKIHPANLSAPSPALKDYRPRNGLQSLRLSELPPIVEDNRHQHGIHGEMPHASNQSLLVSCIGVDKHLHSHNESWVGILQPSNPSQSLEDEVSQHLHQLQGVMIQPLEDKRPQLGQLLPALELQASQHGALSVEREMVQSASPLKDEKYQYICGFYGDKNVQHLNLSAPLTSSGPKMPYHGFISSWEVNPFILDDGTVSTMEGGRPNGKPYSIRDRPRHPLIDAVAAHDKSTLRKISELVQASAKPEADERDTLLAQIRNKSFNLKPAAGAKPNIKGPMTNLKVAAILEKVSAIRQACAGSDEDDDADNWSDC